MKSFEGDYVLRQPLTPALIGTVRVIGEFKGKQDLWHERFPELLKRLQEVAVIQSTESSNRIEGVTAPPQRLRELVAQKTTPANRSEEEIAGYRDVLATIHASHEYVKIKPSVILQLHRDLYKFSAEAGGRWKQVDNEIADVHSDGTRTTRFTCVPALLTPDWMQRLSDGLIRSWEQEAIDPLLLIPAFILDFLCIHPFRDGNGRIARLLTLVLLYEAGYEVGRYVSLERIIEESKESYYEALKAASVGWHEGLHDLTPWRDYLLGTIVAAYRELERRADLVTAIPGAKRAMVREAIEHMIGEFTIKAVEDSCPAVGRDTVRFVLKDMRAHGRVECLGKGRWAKWRRIV